MRDSDTLMVHDSANAAEDVVKVTTIQLVAEKDLEAAKATFETLNSIHIYSLSPTPTSDVKLLNDLKKKIPKKTAADEKIEKCKG